MLKRFLARLLERARPAPRAAWEGAGGAGVLRIAGDGRIIAASPQASDLLGAKAALKGTRISDYFGEGAQALSAADSGARLQLASPRGLLEVIVDRAADGGASLLLLPAPEAEDTAKLRAEAEAARREAKQTADLLADLSHEMRTPLNAVIGFAGAMRAEMFGPLGHEKYDEYADHIRASGEHLLDLVSAILDLSKIEADRFSLKREAVDAGALAEECAGIIRLSAEAAGLKLVTTIADDIPESYLDPRAVRQIVLNLLSNAVKFTSDGEIGLDVKAHGGDIIITVTDTGVGMSQVELAKLGARFTTAHGEGVRGAKGAGLGLALAFALSELHGGSMKLSSAPGEGLTARVSLPVVPPASPRRRRESASSTGAQNPALLTQLERIEAYRRERASAA